MNDFAGQKNISTGEAPPRLVGIVDGAIDAVTEPELVREMHQQSTAGVLEIVGADAIDEGAVVGRCEFFRDGFFHVEALAKNQGLGRTHQ